MKTITDYEIICHGIERSDYFQGCGTAFTEFTDVATGIGSSEKEALEDALDQLAQSDWNTESNPDLRTDIGRADYTDVIDEFDDDDDGDEDYDAPSVYVSVRVR